MCLSSHISSSHTPSRFSFGLFTLSIYISSFYIRSIIRQNLAAWDIVFPGMYRATNFKSNTGIAIHFIGAAYFVLMAPLQYIPSFRRKYLQFHRVNGRMAVALLTITALGGCYYTYEAGVSQVPEEYQSSANWSMYVFGISVLACTTMIYYHAAITKQIDRHQLWAYRLAGIIFGSQMYFRLIFLVEVVVLRAESFSDIGIKSTLFVLWSFAVPFAFLGDVVYWKLHGDKKTGEGAMVEGDAKKSGETKQLLERREEEETGSAASSPWEDVGLAAVYATLLVIFIVTLSMWAVFSWVPYFTVDFDNPVLPSWASDAMGTSGTKR